MTPFILISPATRGISLELVRHFLSTTSLPVFGTYRPTPSSCNDQPRTPGSVREHILRPLADRNIDPTRLHTLPLDLTSEASIRSAADALARILSELSDGPSYVRTALFLGGMLYPERQPADLALSTILDTFGLNVVSHLLLIKHFSRFLPPPSGSSSSSAASAAASASAKIKSDADAAMTKWVHVSARVGSISDNHLGGWYSYRASKAALNQVIRTFDLHLQARKLPAICVGVHPGTVRTDLSKAFWKSVPPGKLFAPQDAAAKIAGVVQKLRESQRGRVWDWKGEEVMP